MFGASNSRIHNHLNIEELTMNKCPTCGGPLDYVGYDTDEAAPEDHFLYHHFYCEDCGAVWLDDELEGYWGFVDIPPAKETDND
jgi:uncharacterized protein with PIN domain